ncbi:hypothetical protein [Sphingomonas hankookensis]
MDRLNGLTPRSAKMAVKPQGHANTDDWVPWRIKQDKQDLTRLQLERRIQDGRPRLGQELWESIHKRVSSRTYVPKVQEIFIVEIDRIDRVLPTLINDIIPQLRAIDQDLSAWFGEGQ